MLKFSPSLFLLLACAPLASATHYRVYLIGGQSNGNGRGDSAELSVEPLDVEGLASPQENVRFYWHKTQDTNSPNGTLTQDTWIDLQPGSGHGTVNPSGHDSEFGPELSFGRDLAAADPSVNVAIIKYTHGGTNLHTQWSASGANYASFLDTVSRGLAALIADGHTYELAGMLWVQGESDRTSPNDTNYESNLIDLIGRIRSDVFVDPSPGSYALPFLISGLSDSQYSTISTVGDGAYNVRQAQEAVGAITDYQTDFVDTDGLPTYSGTVHFTATAQIAIGEACAAQMLALQENDTDFDGLLLSEEVALGTDSTLADSDGDQQEDGFEVAAGTDPLDASSFFQITDHVLTNGEISLQWPSLDGNVYQIEVSRDLEEWTVVESEYSAQVEPETSTAWTAELDSLFSTDVPDLGPFALYEVDSLVNGDFNSAAFDSADTNPISSASRLIQGGSLTGGGAGLFVLNRTQDQVYFDGHSESGWPGFNFGGVNTADQASAATAGDFFSFSVATSEMVTHESLSYYSDQFGTTGRVDVSYTIAGGEEVFVAQGLVPNQSNAPVTFQMIDFPDFSTEEEVTWTFYLYNSGNVNYGIRFDDISLIASYESEPDDDDEEVEDTESLFFRVRLLSDGVDES